MKAIVGLLGVVGSLGNCCISFLAWLLYGHPWWVAAPWLFMGAIAAALCAEYSRQSNNALAGS